MMDKKLVNLHQGLHSTLELILVKMMEMMKMFLLMRDLVMPLFEEWLAKRPHCIKSLTIRRTSLEDLGDRYPHEDNWGSFVAFTLISPILNPSRYMKPLKMKIGFKLCMKNSIILKETKFGL